LSAAQGRQRLAAALAALYARVPLGIRLGLEPMQAACARAGHPERAFEAVHVGGTNGKGSTCAMLEASARAAGRRTGLYTSPHLVRFAERIRVDGAPIGDDALTTVLEEALEVGAELSFFETATLAAFLAFRAAGVELAVVEVGIGGRLDATNVLPAPRATAITGVAFDHMDRLGDTLGAIAREKAAIAKPGVPMVLGALGPEARGAAIEVAAARGARLVTARELPSDVWVGLAGPHQRANAAVAWALGAELELSEAARREGTRAARWPGRLEHVDVTDGALAGRFVLDGAHNPDGARALERALDGERVGALVFGALADKPWRAMLDVLGGVAAPRFYAPPAGRAPADPALLAATLPGAAAPTLREGLRLALEAAGGDLVVVCGSLYLVGEARALLLGLAPDPIVAL
jgi:dihydrofolate synthase/folylpolyglutamate synthase